MDWCATQSLILKEIRDDPGVTRIPLGTADAILQVSAHTGQLARSDHRDGRALAGTQSRVAGFTRSCRPLPCRDRVSTIRMGNGTPPCLAL